MSFQLAVTHSPKGDQKTAIAELSCGLLDGEKHKLLLGVSRSDGLHHMVEAGHLLKEVSAAGTGDATGPAPMVRFEKTNPAGLHKAGDRPI
jgi:hypothetical protein